MRKLQKTAKFGHRLGTTSRFKPEWYSDSHKIEVVEDVRRCSPEVQFSAMLYFDLEKEDVDIPFDLSYKIDFWNAHNGLEGDWQAFYVGNPVEQLTIKIIFPKNKPYTGYEAQFLDNRDCNIKPKSFDNPKILEGTDINIGSKTITWTINSPNVHYSYRLGWKWEKCEAC